MRSKSLIQHILIQSVLILNISLLTGQVIEKDLSGSWRFQIDREDKGVVEKWFSKRLSDEIYLPGSMAENRKGDDVTLHTQWTASIYDSSFFITRDLKISVQENLKLPFWLTPVKYYVGAAWYQKEITIPTDWKEEKCPLSGAPHTETSSGSTTGGGHAKLLSVPHQYEISDYVTPGSNRITIRVDNRTKSTTWERFPQHHRPDTGKLERDCGKIALQSTPRPTSRICRSIPICKARKPS